MLKISYVFLLLVVLVSSRAYSYQLPLYCALNGEINNDPEWIEKLNAWGALTQPAKTMINNSHEMPLVKKYPGLINLPFVKLCDGPTPIQRLNVNPDQTTIALFVKQDDVSASPYGGNKPRKYQREIGRALAHGAKTIITFGCAGSNHAVAMAEHATKLGLKTICMLNPQPNSSVVRKNLLLHLTNGTELHYYPDNNARKIGTIEKWQDHKNTYGDYPYIIPTGGSTPLGTIGFVDALFELKEQIDQGMLPEPEYIYVPCGSCATTAGLLLGIKALGLKTKIMAIATEPEDTPDEFKQNIIKLFIAANELLHATDPSFPLFNFPEENLIINLDFTGPSYGTFTKEGMEARKLLKEKDDIIVEGTYTAKAFAALLYDVSNQKVKGTILFWNTYCGNEFKERLANADYKKLPVCFHAYFEEDVQELDKI